MKSISFVITLLVTVGVLSGCTTAKVYRQTSKKETVETKVAEPLREEKKEEKPETEYIK